MNQAPLKQLDRANRNPNPGLFHRKVYGNPRRGHAPEQMRKRDLLQANLTGEYYHRQSAEYAKRIRWCIHLGREYWPAHDHKHRAPGDDTNFIFKIPPWHPDGTPNSLGIPDNRAVEAVPFSVRDLLSGLDALSRAFLHLPPC